MLAEPVVAHLRDDRVGHVLVRLSRPHLRDARHQRLVDRRVDPLLLRPGCSRSWFARCQRRWRLANEILCKPPLPGYHWLVAQKATVAEHERLNPTLESLRRPEGGPDPAEEAGRGGVEELASALGITVSAVRQHLTGLEAVGFAAHRSVSDGPGRPRFLYRLSAGAEALFPKYYSELTNELLSYVQDEDPETLERIFERRRQRRVEGAVARLRGKSFPDKVAELARILDEDGYLADFEALPDGTFLVTEHNCAILGVARKWGLACSTEIEFLREAIPEAEHRARRPHDGRRPRLPLRDQTPAVEARCRRQPVPRSSAWAERVAAPALAPASLGLSGPAWQRVAFPSFLFREAEKPCDDLGPKRTQARARWTQNSRSTLAWFHS